LIVATDLQGNVADLEAVEQVFEEAAADEDGATLVITGDLVHGPEIPLRHWPEYLGSYYRCDSVELLAKAEELVERHPGRVHYLLGNHEHAHVGGPIVSKFFADEALRLERLLGPRRTEQVRHWFRSWPLLAVAREAGILLMHGAPHAQIESPDELDAAELSPDGHELGNVDPLLAELLWARATTEPRARNFLRAFDDRLRVAVYGHDVAREGHAIDHEPLLCISTSFGCYDGDKLYLDWDLRERPESAADLARRGLRPLYPDADPIYRARQP
jgi:hypothetical protein